MPIIRSCKICGKQITVYNTIQNKCRSCTYLKATRITKRGKEARQYDLWRDKIAKPYLDKKYGHVCRVPSCEVTENLHVDHIKTRGAHHGLKYDVKNVRYLCFEHHRQVTDGKLTL